MEQGTTKSYQRERTIFDLTCMRDLRKHFPLICCLVLTPPPTPPPSPKEVKELCLTSSVWSTLHENWYQWKPRGRPFDPCFCRCSVLRSYGSKDLRKVEGRMLSDMPQQQRETFNTLSEFHHWSNGYECNSPE